MHSSKALLAPPDHGATAVADVPWGIAEALSALLLTLAVALVGQVALLAASPDLYHHHMLDFNIAGEQFFVLGVITSTVLLVLVRWHARLSLLGFAFPGWRRVLGTVLLGFATALVSVAVVDAIFSTFFPWYHLQGNARQAFPGSLKHLSAGKQILILAWVAVEVPLAEETLFRGIIYQGIRHMYRRWFSYRSSVLSAAVTSGLVFGLAHLEPQTFPILVVVGIVLAYVFELSGLYASAMLHGLINGLQAFLLMRGLS